MATNIVKLNPAYFPDPSVGKPIANADIFVGIPDLDPEVPANQKQISVQQEDGTIVDISQPISTGAGGTPLYLGSPVTILVDGNYSLKVLSKQGSQIYSIPNVPGEGATVDSLADLKAFTGQVSGVVVNMLGRTIPGDGGGGAFFWDTSDLSIKVSNDTQSGIYPPPDTDPTGASGAWKRIYTGAIHSSWFGTGYAAIKAAIEDFGGKVIIDQDETLDNSTGPISLPAGLCLMGCSSALTFTDRTQRFFLAQGKTDITFRDVRIFSNDEAMEGAIGGGYVRFENCTNVKMMNVEVSNHAWDGVKFIDSSDLLLKDCTGNYGKSTAITFETCDEFQVIGGQFNKNGLNSADDTFADLPTGWTGTHVGRSVTMTDGCTNGLISGIESRLNSEYGIRSFASATTAGNSSITIENNRVEDNGHPSGTYGPVVLGADKGADILVGTNPTISDTEDIHIAGNKVKRSTKAYGTPVSLAGNEFTVRDNIVRMSGSAIHLLNAYQLFGPVDSKFVNNVSYGANQHYLVGGGGASDLEHINDSANDCLIFYQSAPGGSNRVIGARAKHRATAAVSGENGFFTFTSGTWELRDVLLDGFHRGIENSVTDVIFDNIRTINSVDVGFRNFQVNAAGVIQRDCQWDSQNPFEKSAMVYEANTPRAAGLSFAFSIPTQGYYKAGHVVFDSQVNAVDVTHNRRPIGWYRLTTGTNHVLDTDWQVMWIHVDATTA